MNSGGLAILLYEFTSLGLSMAMSKHSAVCVSAPGWTGNY